MEEDTAADAVSGSCTAMSAPAKGPARVEQPSLGVKICPSTGLPPPHDVTDGDISSRRTSHLYAKRHAVVCSDAATPSPANGDGRARIEADTASAPCATEPYRE
ncbi:hypothetical protein V3C99_000745 [Haemonchus contortus]